MQVPKKSRKKRDVREEERERRMIPHGAKTNVVISITRGPQIFNTSFQVYAMKEF